jgi:tight adherence protein B
VVSLLLTSLALLCWPDARASARLHVIAGKPGRKRLRMPRPTATMALAIAAAVGWLVAGLGGAVAATLLTATGRHHLRTTGQSRQSLTEVDGLAEALRSLVAGLRAGAHPATAAEHAATDAPPNTATTMHAIAAAARIDGDVTSALPTARTPASAAALTRVSTAWQLAQRHGLPLADVLDAVGRDLEQRARFARQVLARMAGPKASALVLVVLPVLGVAMGETTGAHPLQVLATTMLGQVLLVTGVTLLCAGVAWTGRITNQVARR